MPNDSGMQQKERALTYIRTHGTESPVSEIKKRVAATFKELDERLASIDADTAAAAPSRGGWCIQEIVDHLIASHRPTTAQFESVLRGKDVLEDPVPLGLLSADPMQRTWQELVDELAQVHAEFRSTLEPATDDIPLSARAPVIMEVKTGNAETKYLRWIEFFDWKALALLVRIHTLEHIQQINRILP